MTTATAQDASALVERQVEARSSLEAPKLSPAKGIPGTLTTVKASGPASSTATLQRRIGKKWTTLATQPTGARGTARFETLLPGSRKPVSFRVRFAKRGQTQTTAAAAATVLSLPPSNPSVLSDHVSFDPNHPSQQVMDGVLYFVGWVGGRQGLWKMTSPSASPELIWGGSTDHGGGGVYASMRRAHAGHVYFVYDGKTWATDGSVAGTVKLTDFASFSVVPVGGEVLIRPETIWEPTYRSDGSPGGTTVHERDNGEPAFSGNAVFLEETGLCIYDEPTYVRADNGAASALILTGAPCDAKFQQGTSFAGREWFGWNASGGTPTLWSTDGTVSGTRQELSSAGQPVPATGAFAAAGGLLYFQSQKQIWASDGTAAGTSQVPGARIPTSRISHLVPYQGGVLSLSADDNVRIAAGSRSAAAFPMPKAPEMLDEPVGWGDRVVGEWEEYDGFMGDYQNKVYLWAPSQPAQRFPSATFARVNKKKGPVATVFTFDVSVRGALLPRPKERVTVVVDGQVIDRPKINGNYTTRVQLRGRDLGIGSHVVAFRYAGGEQLMPSPPDEVTIKVTR